MTLAVMWVVTGMIALFANWLVWQNATLREELVREHYRRVLAEQACEHWHTMARMIDEPAGVSMAVRDWRRR